MTSILLFLAVVAAICGWWLSRQRLTAKPWLEAGDAGLFPGAEAVPLSPTALGLGIFLAVAGSLFALLISAYSIRMGLQDWRALPVPRLLWFNTGALIVASGALAWTQVAGRRRDRDGMIVGVLAAGAFSLVFLVGQIAAWRSLSVAGYFLASNPANTFFYLITGVHGLHVLGGLIALGLTGERLWRREDAESLSVSVRLCAAYWHFLLLVWLVLLALLTGWAGDVLAICRGLVS